MTPPRITDGDVHAALARRYALPEWLLEPEVTIDAGRGQDRRADAMAFNLWRSRGSAVHGFEVKVARADWLRELRAPDKAEALWSACNAFFLVSPPGVALPDELPAPWGHLELRGSRLVTVKKPEIAKGPRVSHGVIFRVIGRLAEALAARPTGEEFEKKVEAAAAAKQKWAAEKAERAHAELDMLRKAVGEFEASAGISLTHARWRGTPHELGAAVHRIIECGKGREGLVNQLRAHARELETAAAAVEATGSALVEEMAGGQA